MDINIIILELLSRIKILEEKVCTLEEKVQQSPKNDPRTEKKPPLPVEKISAKYRPLAEFLYENWGKKIVLNYSKIEEIIGFRLPPTAYNIPRSYWANTLTHTYATAWLSVGYKARVDIKTMTVTFEKIIYDGGKV